MNALSLILTLTFAHAQSGEKMTLRSCLERSAADLVKLEAATIGFEDPSRIDGLAGSIRSMYAPRLCEGEVQTMLERDPRALDAQICDAIRVALKPLVPDNDSAGLMQASAVCAR